MKHTVQATLNQIKIAVDSLVLMTDKVKEINLDIKPIEGKRSIVELLAHISLICKADFLILNEATQVEMNEFYRGNCPYTLEDIREALLNNFQFLSEEAARYSNQELLESTTSYWGVTYTRFEWLIEIVGHVYHHRGQLHTLLVQNKLDPKVSLFE